MSENKDAPYTRESHPHTGDPRVDPIARKNRPPVVNKDQEALDSLIKQSTGTEERRKLSKKPWQTLILNPGTGDERAVVGRYYTPQKRTEIWSAPAETRDAYPKFETEEGDIVFQVKGRGVSKNGIRWTEVFTIGQLPDGSKGIKGYGLARWSDINKK